ncbi:Serine/threonine-protein kinase [Actinidia chinensis var. chinensis]|uniref:non-specific serine/threonine protein kinase n=1 Tax=Actinidia chinensis var. chinensis TaxID=1590841 RepID=A0A2R6PXL3_ACTCC|nr:Serine/threonine-protein kinase [Actinidia chinensis var. chinensis]
MENHGRRSNYTLWTHVPDDHCHHQPPPNPSAVAGGAAPNYSGFSRELIDHRDSDAFSHMHGGGGGGEVVSTASETGVGGGRWLPPSKSWARQTEESYQFQMALALRLSSEATCADDPNFLDHVADESESRSLASFGSAESMSHRFWVNGCLSYFDRVPDGFYLIHGMDPYVWTVCTDLQENGHIPSIESLKAVDPGMDSSIEVILIDRRSDPSLKELQNKIDVVSSSCISTKEVVDQLAKIVCNCMGGAASTGEDDFGHIWRECSNDVKKSLGSVVLPIGRLVVGLCRHRALLFKVLADRIDLPCRIAKGCKHCMRDDAASCIVRFGIDREYLVDLIGKPGCLSGPDSSLNGPSSISISSPLRFPRFKQVEPAIDFRSLAKQYFLDTPSLNLVFEDSLTGTVFDGDARALMYPTQSDRQFMDIRSHMPSSSSNSEIPQFPFPTKGTMTNAHGRDLQLPQTTISSAHIVKDPLPPRHIPPIGHREVQPLVGLSDLRGNAVKDLRFVEGGQRVPIKSSRELSFDVEYFDIPWSDLVLKERIGAGSFGTVHRADWNGSDVAVKILMDQDFHPERLKEFLREVAITRRLRHPNIVLFMGAVTQPPNLSIVTEYLSRGSLYRLLHKPGAREVLDETRRLNMAYDVAKGMNYLHNCNPPIVHRDLKSPNLLVDQKYTVKVCDFGLSRLKANTFLSSKSAAGTPEWMAPEVLRDEPSNEKSDIYSFGVILWELATLQLPWSNLNPAQVVAAVGFKQMRLVMPRDVNPRVASIIEACWANEPWKRPSFSTIMESLRPLITPPTSEPVSADTHLLKRSCTKPRK